MENINIKMPLAKYAPLEKYSEKYFMDGAQHQPLRVRVELNDGAQVLGYEPIHLDNLLCSVVVNEAWNEVGIWEWQKRPAALPAPLKVLWADERGLPYYACSVLLPVGETVDDVTYFHKRVPSGSFSKGNPKTGNLKCSPVRGRWMERRIPMKTTCVAEMEAFCIGDPAEISRLLQQVSHIGKKRGSGFGEVISWNIEPVDISAVDCVLQNGKLIKPMPMEVAKNLDVDVSGALYRIGWSPPQWMPSAFSAGWAVGTAAKVN